VRVQMKDGTVFVMPGDTMYPKEVELLEKQSIDRSDVTMDEFGKITPIKNRTEFHDTQTNVIFTDIVNGEDSRVVFSTLPEYSKKTYENVETKNKL